MRKPIFFFLSIFIPTLCYGALPEDPCYPDQVPVDTPEECHDITELSWGGVSPSETIAPGTTGQVTVLNGLPPFTYEIEGSGFTFEGTAENSPSRTITVRANTCGTATVTVTDKCKKIVRGQVYTTTGSWVVDSSYDGSTCPATAPMAEWTPPGGSYQPYILIRGEYRLAEYTRRTGNITTYCGHSDYPYTYCGYPVTCNPNPSYPISCITDKCRAALAASGQLGNLNLYVGGENQCCAYEYTGYDCQNNPDSTACVRSFWDFTNYKTLQKWQCPE